MGTDQPTPAASHTESCDNLNKPLDWTNPRIVRAGIEIVEWLLTEGARIKEDQNHGKSGILSGNLQRRSM